MSVQPCPTCGAERRAGVKQCWLCGADATAAVTVPATRRDVWSEGRLSTITTIAILVALVAVGVGLARQAPGLAVAFAVVVSPGLLRMLYESVQGRVEGYPLTLGEKLETLIRSTVAAVGVVALVGVAAVVGFCVVCLASLR